ncbi:MAG: cytochrome C oxidase Cbb3, partial [Eggerthellaceae bacterium]
MDFEYHINRHREQVSKGLKLARNVLVIVLIALFLEVFLFNINHYRSSGYETISLDDELTFTETKGESYRITAANHLFEIHDLNKEVKNIHIEFDQAQPAQVVPIQINFTDSAHESYFYDTEFTAGIPLVDVSTNNWQSQYIYLETTGYVDDLRIDFGDSETLYPLVLKSLTI